MKMIFTTAFALCCLISTKSFAEYGYRAGGFITCSTVSNDIEFSKSERDGNLAAQLARQSCMQDRRTINSECTANIACDDQYAQPFLTCSTVSNGIEFTKTERSQSLAQQLVQQSCMQDRRTNNAECSANIYCDNQRETPYVTCSTLSNGIEFSKSERSQELASRLSRQACMQDRRTNNAECSANIYCETEQRRRSRHY